MAATIRTTCVSCGSVDVPVDQARLSLSMTAGDRRNVLDFVCPSCRREVTQRMTERATRLLADAGITVAMPAASTAAADSGPRVTD